MAIEFSNIIDVKDTAQLRHMYDVTNDRHVVQDLLFGYIFSVDTACCEVFFRSPDGLVKVKASPARYRIDTPQLSPRISTICRFLWNHDLLERDFEMTDKFPEDFWDFESAYYQECHFLL